MVQGLVKYDNSMREVPALPGAERIPSTSNIRSGVYLTIPADKREWILETLSAWFKNRPEVLLVDTGITDKQQFGYIMLEWLGYEVDTLFIDILRSDTSALDYTLYKREENTNA